MAAFTLSPIEGRTFAIQTLVVALMAIALLVVFPSPAPGNNGFAAGISMSGTTFLFVSSIAALPIVGAVALILRDLASRLLTLGCPAALTATALLLILNDLGLGFVFRRLAVLNGNILILAGLLGAVAIMRPVVNWWRDKITLCFVVAVALIGIDQYTVLTRSMLLPGTDGTFPWSLRVAALTGLTKMLHLPLGAFSGGLLLGLGCIQRKMSRDAVSHQFAPIPLGVLLAAAIILGVVASTALYVQFDVATGAGSPRRLLMMIPLNALLYAAPTFCILAAFASRSGRFLWLLFCVASLLPIATWIGQRHLVDRRAVEVAKLNAEPIDWSAVPIQGRPFMVDHATPDVEARAQQRGFGGTFSFRYVESVYVCRGGGDRFDGPDNFVEVTLGEHKPGRRFSAESGRPRFPTAILHVYDVRDGRRMLLGTRIVERNLPPAFPPYLDVDGSWVLDRKRIREASEADVIVRILDEIPPR